MCICVYVCACACVCMRVCVINHACARGCGCHTGRRGRRQCGWGARSRRRRQTWPPAHVAQATVSMHIAERCRRGRGVRGSGRTRSMFQRVTHACTYLATISGAHRCLGPSGNALADPGLVEFPRHPYPCACTSRTGRRSAQRRRGPAPAAPRSPAALPHARRPSRPHCPCSSTAGTPAHGHSDSVCMCVRVR
jgi:hypothetical protein